MIGYLPRDHRLTWATWAKFINKSKYMCVNNKGVTSLYLARYHTIVTESPFKSVIHMDGKVRGASLVVFMVDKSIVELGCYRKKV